MLASRIRDAPPAKSMPVPGTWDQLPFCHQRYLEDVMKVMDPKMGRVCQVMGEA